MTLLRFGMCSQCSTSRSWERCSGTSSSTCCIRWWIEFRIRPLLHPFPIFPTLLLKRRKVRRKGAGKTGETYSGFTFCLDWAAGARIEKAEETAKALETLKDEITSITEQKGEQADWQKLIDDRLQEIEKGFQKMDLGELVTLPPRVSTLEGVTKDINDSITGLEGELVNQALIQKDLLGKEEERERDEAEEDKEREAAALAAAQAAAQQAAQEAAFGAMAGDKLAALDSGFADMSDRLKRLESQIEALKEMLIQTAKAQASDLEAIQKACRALRSDFENDTFTRPLEDAKSGDGGSGGRAGGRASDAGSGKGGGRPSLGGGVPAEMESMNVMYNELRDNLSALQNNFTSLAERSDLAVLLAKRAEQVSVPVASIHGDMDSLDEEVTFVVNEHANRIMLYADMFLQLEVLIASKADGKQLQALRDAMAEMQQGSGMKMGEDMKATLKSHERMIMQLVEKVGILGKGVLIMAGHDPAHDPAVAMQQAMEQIAKAEQEHNVRRASEKATAAAATAAGISPSAYAPPTPSALAPLPPPLYAPPPPPPPVYAPPPPPAPAPPPQAPPEAALPAQRFSLQTSPEAALPAQRFSVQCPPEAAPPAQRLSLQAAAQNPPPHSDTVRFADEFAENQSGEVIPLTPYMLNPQGEVHRGTTFSASRAIHEESGPGPHRVSSLRIRSVEEASRMVLGTRYQETLGALEDALNANKIEPKENMLVLARLVKEMENVILDLERHLALIASLEEGLETKADKADLARLEKLLRESKAVQNAMLSGKPLLGFKCMSCDHPLQKLNPLRAEHVPTGVMPRNYLSMLSAERIFANENIRRDPSPPQTPPRTPPTAEMLRGGRGSNGGETARLRKSTMGGFGGPQSPVQSPYSVSLPRRGSAGKS
ncbi:hypothetical protein R1flu_014980 [Riccia fluitans]|uniref:Uncharacterized protein n=1 Tax=Riccia fluitans TaxID=41844 RepID=A0ABD1YKY6_9MARC